MADTNDTQIMHGRHRNQFQCPHCKSSARVKTSRRISPLFMDGIVECQNIDTCGWCGRYCTELVATLMPAQRRVGTTKEHYCQLTPDRLGKLFAEVRDSTKLFAGISESATPPTFHEIRALASDRDRAMGYSTREAQQVMAHTDERVTKGYQAGHGIKLTTIEISLGEEVIAGKFRFADRFSRRDNKIGDR